MESIARIPIALADRARATALRYVAGTRLRPLVARRTARIGARAVVAIVGALVLSSTFPALALAVGPLLFGVPHVAASLRYLVVRRGIARWLVASIVLASLVIVGARVTAGLDGWNGRALSCARTEMVAGASLFGLACVAAAKKRGSVARGAVGLAVLSAGLGAALYAPFLVRMAFVHVHNLGVVALWMLMFRRNGALPKLVGAALLGSLLLIASGVTVPVAQSLGGLELAGVDCRAVASWLTPASVDTAARGAMGSFAMPLVVAHAFTDSVHYAFWLGVVPEEELSGEGTLSFRMTVRGVLRDFGVLATVLVVGVAAAVALSGLLRGTLTRDAYFAVAGFHGYVEGAMLVYWLVLGGSVLPRARWVQSDAVGRMAR
ncbi:MAG: hypothetical protein HOO96_26185 [Polyangiaceae bacterium]|nr:hypothetical protein [Polyangiaceae bacterium]